MSPRVVPDGVAGQQVDSVVASNCLWVITTHREFDTSPSMGCTTEY